MVIYGTAFIIVIALLLDCLIGDPQNPFHPIRFIGNGISLGIKGFKKAGAKSNTARFIMGAALTLLIIGVSYTVTRAATWGLYQVNYWLGLAIEAVFCYFLIAPRALRDER
jgi:adenosylcobinamide-phosphate synthase